MNVIKFEQNRCKKIQADLDSYLNNELPSETAKEVSTHLENCPDCQNALLTRQQVKAMLKRAVLKEAAPTELQQKIKSSLRQNPSTSRTWWMITAAAMIALIIGGTIALRLSHRSTPVDSVAVSTASQADVELLKIGLGDHVHCAIDSGLANHVFSEEEMSTRLGPDFSGLVAKVKERAPENYRVVVAHRCKFNGREFVHLILKSPETVLSLVLTKKSGEAFSDDAVAAASLSAIHEAPLTNYPVAGFEIRDYLAFVVSNLSRNDNLKMASTLAPTVRELLTKLEA